MTVKLFQISNIDTANLQSEIAIEMAKETQVQVNLAKRNDSQNKSIMVFTVITVIFLPLSFFTSYFGKFI
jgi:Mg2+ and Co2+ transporter CorA